MQLARYGGLGLKEQLIIDFIKYRNFKEWYRNNFSSGAMKNAFRKYLIDLKLIQPNGELTQLGNLIKEIHKLNKDIFWQMIWVNLSLYSPVFEWYNRHVPFKTKWTRNSLTEKIVKEMKYKEKTAQAIANSITQTFFKRPKHITHLGKWFGKRNKKGIFEKRGIEEGINIYAIGFLIYQLAQKESCFNYPTKILIKKIENIFGTDTKSIEETLKYLEKEKLIELEFDSVVLESKRKPECILKKFLKKRIFNTVI